MPPVPIYSQSPISAAKASGVTPKTDNAGNDSRAPENPTTTRPSGAGAAPPPAQPGAVPTLPRPSGGAHVPCHYALLAKPTPTATTAGRSPPPPQPGAVPVPPGSGPPRTGETYHQRPQQTAVPPPPRAGETLSGGNSTAATMPPQMAVPPLTAASYPASRGTATATQPTHGACPSLPQPTGLAQGTVEQRNLDHPPGYVQNAYAADMNSSQRAAANLASSGQATYGNSNTLYGGEESSEGIWDSAKKLAWAAGERLSAAETEVWRRINKEQ